MIREQGPAAAGRSLFDMAGDQQRRQRGLSVGKALRGRKFEPAPTLGAALGHALALEVAQADAIFGGGELRLCGARHELEAGIEIARNERGLAFFEKPRRSAEVEPPENQQIRPLYSASLSDSGGACKRSPPLPPGP